VGLVCVFDDGGFLAGFGYWVNPPPTNPQFSLN
jgi:hypothetical protein